MSRALHDNFSLDATIGLFFITFQIFYVEVHHGKKALFLVGGSNTLPYIFLTFWILFRLVFFRMFASFEFLVDDL